MSLFGGYDAEHVPLLTQFLQVEPLADNDGELPTGVRESEMAAWLQQTQAYEGPQQRVVHFRDEHGKEWARSEPHVGKTVSGETVLQVLPWEGWLGQMHFLQHLHALARRISAAIADGEGVIETDLATLNSLLRKTLRHSVGITDPTGPTPIRKPNQQSSGRVPQEQLILSETPWTPRVGGLLLLELYALLGKPKGARRCEECHFPFVVLRADQRFCSRRCADTHGHRRRRGGARQKRTAKEEDSRPILLKY